MIYRESQKKTKKGKLNNLYKSIKGNFYSTISIHEFLGIKTIDSF